MANVKITDLGLMGAAIASGDLVEGVDVSDTTDDAAGSSKKFTAAQLATHVSANLTALSVDTAELAADAVTYAKIQNVTATDKLLGRSTAGAGIVEEIALTAAGRALIDDASASAQRTTLGLVIGTDVAGLGTAQEYTKTQNFNATSLTSTAASIAWDAESNQVAKHTFTENTTLANPTNLVDGATYIITFTQHASSPKTLAFGSAYKFPGGTAPTVTATNSAVDIITFVSDGTNLYGVSQLDFS